MAKIFLYNTLSKQKEEFKPISQGFLGLGKKTVRMYNCGPTVYDYAHIGNLKAYVFADTLRRMFEYNGYKVRQVINITDVGHLSSDADSGEDKMTKALKRENKPLTLVAMREIADFYAQTFQDDLKSLNIETAYKYPFASEHIKEIIEIVDRLSKKGFAYKISDGIYFDVKKFPAYGTLGGTNNQREESQNRIAENTEKHDFRDFCLWKYSARGGSASGGNELGWESPFGPGFPGWHIECSAMARKYLGQPFDIHTGGIDHISIHHNNEIAQSECAFNAPLAKIWMHSAFLTINAGRMGKSVGNFITLKTLKEKNIHPLAYRYWLLTANYRTNIDFSFEALEASQKALDRLREALSIIVKVGKISEKYKSEFTEFVNDDLDTSKALALVWKLLADNSVKDEDKKATILDFDKVFGLNLAEEIKENKAEIPAEIQRLAELRRSAREQKNWVESDRLRDEIEAKGWTIKDTSNKFELSVKN